VASLLFLGLLLANAAEKKNTPTSPIEAKSKAKLSVLKKADLLSSEVKGEEAAGLGAGRLSGAAQPPILFEDHFEGNLPTWISDASWNHVETPIGRAFQDSSGWKLDSTNASSPTHSWHNTVALNQELDFLISPVIQLPESVVVGGVPSILKGAKLSMMIDYDDPDADDFFSPMAGLATTWWHFDNTEPGAGSSSWRIDIPETGDADHHRQWLMTPPIDLRAPGVTAPVTLTFLHKYLSETDFDYYAVDVSTDDFRSYTNLLVFDGGPVSSGGTVPGQPAWDDTTADLSAFIGQVIRIRFSSKGDYGFTEPHAHWALDNITVAHAGGTLFFDDGGETGTSQMTKGGFLPGAILANYQVLTPHPTPSWIAFEWPKNVFDGFNGQIGPGDSIRIGFRWNSDGDAVAGRGIYIDDVVLTGVGKLANDVAAVKVDVPFPAKVGQPLTFALGIANAGTNPQTNVAWQGNIFDAAGVRVASVAGRSGPIAPDEVVKAPALTTWTPANPGIYRIQAFTRLSGDEDTTNDTTLVANDDANGIGDARYSPFVVHQENVLFSATLWDAPADPTPRRLLAAGFQVRSAPEPGVVTWQTTNNARVPAANGIVGHGGAYIVFDSLGRPQDEELIIPNLDFSFITSNATLSFKGLGTGGFPGGYTRFSIGVSGDGGHTWSDVFERRRGVDPQTGQNFGGPAIFTAAMRPGLLDITRYAAGRWNVWIRFRYEGINDGDWLVWSVALSGKGLLAAKLNSVVDVPNDQGKQVRLTWDRSPNDGQLAGVPITVYGVWRQVPGSGASKPAGDDVIQVENLRAMIANIEGLKPGSRFYVAEAAAGWDFVGSVLAHSDPVYNFVAPTLQDSVLTTFMVSAHTANPLVFANSNVASGMSIDNLPPGAPINPVVAVEDRKAVLKWEAPEDPDVRFYSVYRSTTAGVYTQPPIARTGDLTYTDATVQLGVRYYYTITATDYGFNESQRSSEVSVIVTRVDGRDIAGIPTSYNLAQNYPNPFNPETVIRYQLPKAGKVSLRVLNLLGQEIRTLVEGEKAPGYYSTVWDGRDDSGRPVPSGVYVYRLETSGYTAMKKLVLMK